MSELKQLKQLSQVDAEKIGGGEGDCPVTVEFGPVTNSGTDVGTTIIGTYEGIIQATSYALERVINAVSSD